MAGAAGLSPTRLVERCEARSGIAAFDRLVDQVMTQAPYRSARRVFWVMDNGSAHRGAKGDARLRDHWPTLEHYLMAFQHRYQGAARPFRWTFTRADLQRLLTKPATAAEPVRPAA